jgi:hypothetical protein
MVLAEVLRYVRELLLKKPVGRRSESVDQSMYAIVPLPVEYKYETLAGTPGLGMPRSTVR